VKREFLPTTLLELGFLGWSTWSRRRGRTNGSGAVAPERKRQSHNPNKSWLPRLESIASIVASGLFGGCEKSKKQNLKKKQKLPPIFFEDLLPFFQ